CAACVRFLDCEDLDRASSAVAALASHRADKAPILAGDCGYLVRHLAALPRDAAMAAERECSVRYRGEIAVLYGALTAIEPGADRAGPGRRPLGYLVGLVDDPRTAAQA